MYGAETDVDNAAKRCYVAAALVQHLPSQPSAGVSRAVGTGDTPTVAQLGSEGLERAEEDHSEAYDFVRQLEVGSFFPEKDEDKAQQLQEHPD